MDVRLMDEDKYKRKQLLKHMTQQVNLLKEKTRKETGAFKYDFAYDEVLELLKKYEK